MPLTQAEAEALLGTLLRREVARAGGNRWVSRKEQAALPAGLDTIADDIRLENGPGARVRADALVDRATVELLSAFGGQTDRIRDWFEAFDFATRRFSAESLPEGGRVDAREGQLERKGVPAGVLAAFDFWIRIERADIGSVSLHQGRLADRDVWVVFVTNDGEQGALEVLDPSGATLEGATLLQGRIVSWDVFPRQSRLVAWVLALDGPSFEDGLSEVDERSAAGQVPMDYQGDGELDEGTLRGVADLLTRVELPVALPASDRDLVYAAFSHLWSAHLRFRAEDDITPLRGNGRLRYGRFTRCTTGRTYWVADWRDIDDGSYVLYFEADAVRPVLSTVQFDN